MSDETPHEDGPEPAPGSGRPATDRKVPAPAPPPDDDAAPPSTGATTEPEGPAPPAEPGRTTDPPEPGRAAEPGKPRQPADAAEPGQAVEPGPSQATDPGEPDQAVGRGKPGQAAGSGDLDESSRQDQSGEAGDSEQDAEPSEQGQADRSGDDAGETGGERDPSTGTPVGLPAKLPDGAPDAPDPDAPDPAHDVEQRRREAGVDHRFPFGRPGQPLGRAHPFVFGFTAALGVITAWLLVQAASNAKSVIVMIVVAMFLAVGLNPAVERLRRFGLPRGGAVAAVFLLVILFFAGFVASLVQPVSEQVTELRRSIPEYVEQLQDNETLANWDKRYGLLDRAEETVKGDDFQKSLTDIATGIGKVAVNGVFQTVTILILTLYFMSSLPQIKMFAYKLAPRSRRARVALLGDEILDRIGGYVAGQFTIAFIAGTCSYIFLSILGVKYALALALIVAVTDLIPLIGATIGAVVVCLVAFLTGDLTDLIVCAIFYLIYQQVENYVVYPRVMKRTVDVQPAVTIVAALIGGALLGVVGALLAIPTAAAISLLIREVVMPRQETM